MFVRTENLRSYIRLYPVNSVFLLICAVMFIVMTFSGGTENNETLLKFGAFVTPFPTEPFSDLWGGNLDYFRFVSAIFIHIGFPHILFNGFALFVFAPELERLFGHVRYAIFFIVTGIAGNIASHIHHSITFDNLYALSAGASGAIFGVFGAYLALAIFRKSYLDKGTYTTIMTLVIMGAVYSFIVPNVGWDAHLGGFVVGFIWMFYLLQVKRKRRTQAN